MFQGAFGVVREGTHKITGECVALKLVNKTLISKEYLKTHIHREPQILQRLYHPNIVQLFEIIETDAVLCIVLEMCPVDTLSMLSSSGPMSVNHIIPPPLPPFFVFLSTWHQTTLV